MISQFHTKQAGGLNACIGQRANKYDPVNIVLLQFAGQDRYSAKPLLRLSAL